MQTNESTKHDGQQTADVPFAANDVRLSPREWLVAAVLIAGAFWLIPLIIVMLALGSLLVLTNSALAPFIYTLF